VARQGVRAPREKAGGDFFVRAKRHRDSTARCASRGEDDWSLETAAEVASILLLLKTTVFVRD
jgi:hypothetical protein